MVQCKLCFYRKTDNVDNLSSLFATDNLTADDLSAIFHRYKFDRLFGSIGDGCRMAVKTFKKSADIVDIFLFCT